MKKTVNNYKHPLKINNTYLFIKKARKLGIIMIHIYQKIMVKLLEMRFYTWLKIQKQIRN